MIDTKINRENLYARLNQLNLVKRIMPLLGPNGKYEARLEDGKFVPKNPTKVIASPWIFVKPAPEIRCDLYHYVLFNVMRIIPSYCRECYKVVVRPRTIIELFDLHELQKEMDVPSKCGIEKRMTTTSPYGGYFYNVGFKNGLGRYKEVRKLVDERLSSETDVILKRY